VRIDIEGIDNIDYWQNLSDGSQNIYIIVNNYGSFKVCVDNIL
jgi:hypothetical protein